MDEDRPRKKSRREKMHEAWQGLVEGYNAGRITITVNPNRFARSPYGRPAEIVVPLLVLILGSLLLMVVYGLAAGTVALLASVGLYLGPIRMLVNYRLANRVRTGLLHDPDTMSRLWQTGGITVALTTVPGIQVVAPAGDLFQFVRSHLRDLRGGSAAQKAS